MSNAYYEGYGTQYPTYPAANDQQNIGYMQQIRGTGPSYGLHPNPGYPPAPPPASDEYMRQPAMSPYPSAPVIMPQPMMQQPAAEQEPRVIIVHQNNKAESDSCDDICCGCCAYLMARLCYTILIFILVAVALAVAVYFIKYYRNHH